MVAVCFVCSISHPSVPSIKWTQWNKKNIVISDEQQATCVNVSRLMQCIHYGMVDRTVSQHKRYFNLDNIFKTNKKLEKKFKTKRSHTFCMVSTALRSHTKKLKDFSQQCLKKHKKAKIIALFVKTYLIEKFSMQCDYMFIGAVAHHNRWFFIKIVWENGLAIYSHCTSL